MTSFNPISLLNVSASKVLDATEAEIQNNARKAGLVNAKEVAEGIVGVNNEDTEDGGEDVAADVAEADIADVEGVSNGRTVFFPIMLRPPVG